MTRSLCKCKDELNHGGQLGSCQAKRFLEHHAAAAEDLLATMTFDTPLVIFAAGVLRHLHFVGSCFGSRA